MRLRLRFRRCSVWLLALAVVVRPFPGAAAAPGPHRACVLSVPQCHVPVMLTCCCEDDRNPATPAPVVSARHVPGPPHLVECPRGAYLAIEPERVRGAGLLGSQGRESLDRLALLSTLLI
ncbi:MAG: hypothetical protein HY654_05885 [Acidobacteria bacterium]|nr:hypothetical protein [Acidobacteriota bacterium]